MRKIEVDKYNEREENVNRVQAIDAKLPWMVRAFVPARQQCCLCAREAQKKRLSEYNGVAWLEYLSPFSPSLLLSLFLHPRLSAVVQEYEETRHKFAYCREEYQKKKAELEEARVR